jgi:hypothetical protein
MMHEDGGAYEPVVATVSLGGAICLEVCEKISSLAGEKEEGKEEGDGGREDSVPKRIFQERRSLLVTLDPAYSSTLHGIAPVTSDTHLSSSTVANWDLLGEETRKEVEENAGVSERGTRISLTYRDVKSVSSALSKVLGRRAA